MIGQGAFINAIEGTLRQTRRALEPSSTGKSGIGVIYFSMATSNARSTNGNTDVINPYSFPPEVTPLRSFAEFTSGLTTGKSVNSLRLYEDPAINPIPIFSQPATISDLPWKAAPANGHIMGFAKRGDTTPLDTATVTITNLDTNDTRSTTTDGGGFYGGVDLTPGNYLVKAVLNNETLYSCAANVVAGRVTTADLQVETIAPTTIAMLTPSQPNGTNGWYTSDVTINLSATDAYSGVAVTEYSTDGTNWMPYNGSILISTEGATTVSYRSTDRAGNTETVKTVTVQIDKTAPTINLTANPNRIFPPNGQSVTVTLSGVGSDAISGLASVSYVVTDEYGTMLNIPTRTLSGNSASWTDLLIVEARRRGNDLDGRLYRVTATIMDAAGNTSTATADIVIQHDQGNQ
jgi:hypothetical protein